MAMTLRLTPEETEALRRQAEAEHRSMQEVVREAVREYVMRRAHKARVRESSRRGADVFAEALDRLGNL